MEPCRDAPATHREECQVGWPVRAEELEQAADEAPALVAAGRGWEQPVIAPAGLVQVDERVEVGERVARDIEPDLALALRAAELAADLVALLLVEGGEEAVEVGAVRDDRHGADVLALLRHVPAGAGALGPERGEERVWVEKASGVVVKMVLDD